MFFISILTIASIVLWITVIYDPTIIDFASMISWCWIMFMGFFISDDIYGQIKRIKKGKNVAEINIMGYSVVGGIKILFILVIWIIMMNKGYGESMFIFFGYSVLYIFIVALRIIMDMNELKDVSFEIKKNEFKKSY